MKLLQRPTSKSECSKLALQRSREVTRIGLLYRDDVGLRDMAEGQGHFQRSQLSIFGITEHPEGDERTPTPPPSPGTLPNCHAKQPAITAQAKTRSRKGEQYVTMKQNKNCQ